MGFEIKQSQKQSLKLTMTTQLQQAIKLLHLTRLDLEQFVSQQLAENPTLEESSYETLEERDISEREKEKTIEDVVGNQVTEAAGVVDSIGEKKKEDIDWDVLSRQKEAGQQSSTKASKNNNAGDDHPNYENLSSKEETLAEHLTKQVREIDFDEAEKKIATSIVGNINQKGYLDISVEELAKQENCSEEAIEDVLDTIQRFDPLGVAARDLQECLLNQIRGQQLKNGIVEKIVEQHLKELENNNFAVISKSLGIPIEDVIENVATIVSLEPNPGREFSEGVTQVIIPDVYIFKLGDEWQVALNEEGIPTLGVSKTYQDMMKEKAIGDDKAYLKEKLKDAQWLIKSIQQRQRTIFKATESILKKQIQFFEEGVQYLKPMVLRDIAEDIEMHESTISRVTNGKYVHTPRGIFELKYFFNSSVSKAGGSDMASESVKVMIKDIVAKEDPKKPYSDQKIVDFLEKKGIQLARRTVAKYREQIGILPSSKRKKFY